MKLPSQTKHITAYTVAIGTANAALGNLVGIGLARIVPGSNMRTDRRTAPSACAPAPIRCRIAPGFCSRPEHHQRP